MSPRDTRKLGEPIACVVGRGDGHGRRSCSQFPGLEARPSHISLHGLIGYVAMASKSSAPSLPLLTLQHSRVAGERQVTAFAKVGRVHEPVSIDRGSSGNGYSPTSNRRRRIRVAPKSPCRSAVSWKLYCLPQHRDDPEVPVLITYSHRLAPRVRTAGSVSPPARQTAADFLVRA
ncbi:hypothetical protein HPB49_011457 [Dermacentor silvarum]|uniref:Uncharacterized protein n=1 Tax=Dermacentor silvarum TaxID=543639 RepID=A0ACB8DZY6_DERSI|nr:hypothetical protein HPB49_011457 [Dermacentor silvarum]